MTVSSSRFLPALSSLLAVALEREQLEQEALEAEALRRSDAVKTTLLRAVSHDLRSPLTAIAAAAGGLKSRELHLDEHDRAELVETILSESTRLERVVADLLDLSRLQAGAVSPVREIWHVDELVGAALDELHDEGNTQVDVSPDLPPVEVDAGQTRRVLVNLLENAHRHATSTARRSHRAPRRRSRKSSYGCATTGPASLQTTRSRCSSPSGAEPWAGAERAWASRSRAASPSRTAAVSARSRQSRAPRWC